VHGAGELVETDAGRVYVELEGDGPLIILAGGGPGVGHAHYHPWFSRLAERRTVAYVDYPGTGRSDPAPDYTLERYAAALEGVRRHVDAERTAIVGLSFGGLPAVAHALTYPGELDALVLSNAQVSHATWQEGNIDNVNRALREHDPEAWEQLLALRAEGVRSLDPRYQALFEGVLDRLEWADPERRPQLERDEAEGMSLGVYEVFIGPDPEWEVTGTLAGFDPLPRLHELRIPTLVVTGRWDGLTTPRLAHLTWKAIGTWADLAILEGSAHRPWAEEPEAYFQLLEDFFDLCAADARRQS
jgi:proline iminopeptidase